MKSYACIPVIIRSAIWLLLLVTLPAHTHPLAPALLSLEEKDELVDVEWKTPLKRRPGTRMHPMLPDSCEGVSEPTSRSQGTGLLISWQLDCKGESLIGKQLSVTGIASSGADVLLRISLADGRVLQKVLSAKEAVYSVPDIQSSWEVTADYTELGIGHLLSGFDHVLFVITLLLLVGWGSNLIWTITFFTLGHSVTLALATLNYISFPSMLAEILIALSIAIAAAELLRKKASILGRKPWLMSGGFGLLHGLGFAGALADVGLPQTDIPLALFSFNIGIEVGQLLVVTAVYFATRIGNNFGQLHMLWQDRLLAYFIGSMAAFWFWQRMGLF